MKVRATEEYEKRGMRAVEIKRIPKKGEIFETTKEKFEILNGNNKYNAIFVEEVKDEFDFDFDKKDSRSKLDKEDFDIINPKKRSKE